MLTRDLWKDSILDVGLGRKYGHSGDTSVDCVRIIAHAVADMYPGVDVRSRWSDLHLSGGQGLGSFDNIKALVELGVAEYVTSPAPGGVTIVQKWKGNRGHMFSILRPETVAPGPDWILHATTDSDWYRPIDLDAYLKGASVLMCKLIHPYDVK
jgi:hypothetical protein